MNNMNVIIADDHPIVLFGIRKSLEQIEWVNVVGEFEDSTALINNLPKLDAHVLITDLSMPGDKYGDGITLIKYIKRHFPSLSIIVLTMNNNPAILSAVLDSDIEGMCVGQGAPPLIAESSRAAEREEIYPGKRFSPVGKIECRRLRRQKLSRQKRVVCACLRRFSWVIKIGQAYGSIKTISSQKKFCDDEAGCRARYRPANYLSSVTLSPADKD
ncbi:response regulator transcription factor RcsB [Shigella flexneri]